MLKSKIAGLSILCSALFSVPASAADTQVIDNFESGTLGSQWSVLSGTYPEDVDVYNAISTFYDGGLGPILYYAPEGNWVAALRAGSGELTVISTHFTTFAEGVFEMQVFFSATEASPANDVAIVNLQSLDNDNDLGLFWQKQTDTTGLGYGMDNTGWVNLSAPLVAGNYTLQLIVYNDIDNNVSSDPLLAIDNIRVTYAVPEPSTYAMMLSALGLVGFVAYRRRTGLSRIGG